MSVLEYSWSITRCYIRKCVCLHCENSMVIRMKLGWSSDSADTQISSLQSDWSHLTSFARIGTILRSLNNHDDDGIKNVTNFHIWQSRTVVLHALHVQFSFLIFRSCSRSFQGVKWPVLQFCGRSEHMMTNGQFCPLISSSEALVLF